MLIKRDPSTIINKPAPFIKEFRIFIHSLHGYMNTFMLGNGKPNLIIPGHDKESNRNGTLQFHHYIVK